MTSRRISPSITVWVGRGAETVGTSRLSCSKAEKTREFQITLGVIEKIPIRRATMSQVLFTSIGCRAAGHRARHAGAGAATAADRDQEGRRHRQRLHLPQRQPSVDVRRHQGRRDRDRPGRLRPAERRPAICRRDQEGHRQADQISDLQPPSLRSHRRRQGIQGRRGHDHRAQEGHGASGSAQRPEHAAAGPDDRR